MVENDGFSVAKRGHGPLKRLMQVRFFLFGGRVEVYGVPLYAKKPIVYYLYFHSNIAYFRSSTLE